MKISIILEGITPLICNKFTDAAALAASAGTRTAVASTDRGTPHAQAESKLYTSVDGKTLILPQPNVLRSLVDGGQYFKAGKKQITTKRESLLYACVDIAVAEIPIIHKEPWTVDTRAVRIPATGGRILCHRPMFNDWQLEFEIDLDESIVNRKLLREIIDAAGKRVGLGDFRPSCKGPFGKYVVNRWEEQVLPIRAVS